MARGRKPKSQVNLEDSLKEIRQELVDNTVFKNWDITKEERIEYGMQVARHATEFAKKMGMKIYDLKDNDEQLKEQTKVVYSFLFDKNC